MSNQTTTISIVMPLYNKEREVTRSIKSVLAQSFTDFEVIVVNDGSTDESPKIVKTIKDPRFRIVDQPNAGVSAARNRGIAESKADLIAFLDADDEWEPDFLKTIIRLRDNFPSCDVFATNYSFHRANDYRRPTIIRGLPVEFKEGILTDYFRIASQSDPPLWTSAVAVTRKALQSVGGFPVGVMTGEDLITWARLAIRYDIAYSVNPQAFFWEPVELPKRIPDCRDVVGRELEVLLTTNASDRNKGLNDYVALWHRMRASIFIRLGNRLKALKEIQRAVQCSGFNLKLLLYFALVFFPKTIFLALMKIRRYYPSVYDLKRRNKKRLSIVTNIPTPYRKDFFVRISNIENIESKVFFCAKRERNRLWDITHIMNYSHEFVPGWQITHDNGAAIYINIGLLLALKRFKPDLIIVGGASIPSLLCLLYKKLFGCRVYIWWAGTDLSEKDRNNLKIRFRKWLFKRMDGFFAYSDYSRNYLESFSITSNRITVIGNNTLDSEQYGLDVRKNKVGKSLTYLNSFNILVVAQLIPRKNIMTILEVYSSLWRKYPNVILDIAGVGPEEQKLKTFCMENKLENVQFLGNVQPQDLKKYYTEADVLVSTARMDQWPQVVNEAMSCGVPVIVSTTSGIDTHFLQDGINGYFIDPEDKETLRRRLEHLVLNPDRAMSMGREAFRIAREHDVHHVIRCIESVILNERLVHN